MANESDDGDSSNSACAYKIAVVARSDLRMTAGKLASQVGHAVHDAVVGCGAKKTASTIVVLQVCGEAGLQEVEKVAASLGINTADVVDEGLTELESDTRTVVAVGPDEAARVDSVTGRLQLYHTAHEEELQELRRRLSETEAELDRLRRPSQPLQELACVPMPSAWYALDILGPCVAAVVPELFELWTWEGNLSVLPFKWTEVIEECYGEAAMTSGVIGSAVLRPWETAGFDPQGIFFLTHRSQTCGIAAALPNSPTVGSQSGSTEGVIVGLAVRPEFRREGLEQCLLRLCIHHHATLGRSRVFCNMSEEWSTDACAMLATHGFLPSEGPST
eukprot:TRINITY_DN28468_c0_g1_i1.p1 TRINITY_DN28468_c0_g1~~TRINITY_DN28468_c0_g1_i1.p1  ORF type:complete len:333 (+),score=65.05 TRINITY_DN28468_c0_g1_i1:107-1105(+)